MSKHWVQLDIGGHEMPDVSSGRPWGWRARGANRWLRPASLASEVKVALRRTRLVPAVPAKQYRAWAVGESRPIPTTFYDGATDTKRLAYRQAV